ncbi:MAG: hypothetical protein ACP5QT_08985 [Brevinematia bacterium]
MRFFLICIFLFLFNLSFPQMVKEYLYEQNRGSLTNEMGFLLLLEGEKYRRLNEVISVHPMTKLEFYFRENYPVRDDSFMTELSFNASPISLNGNIEFSWKTLGRMLDFPAGVIFGTGWYNDFFGGGVGIYSNFYDESIKDNTYAMESFSKIYLKYYLGSFLKLDTADFFEGNSHFQLNIGQYIYYRYFLGTKKDTDIWMYEDKADNLKYFRYIYHIYVGCILPFLLNRVGLFYRSDYDIQHYNDSKAKDEGWGSDIPVTRFGLILSCGRVEKERCLDFILTWGNEPNYQQDYGYNLILYQRKREKSVYEYWFLREVTLIFRYKI